MKTFSPVAVALVSSCLVFFHSNPAFAAIIDAAGAPPEDAALAPLDEPDDGTGKWNTTTVLILANKSPTTKREIEIGCCVRLIVFLVPFCFVLFCFVSSFLNNSLALFSFVSLQLQLLRSSMPFRRRLRPFLVVVVVVH